jgi:hypothetical protein
MKVQKKDYYISNEQLEKLDWFHGRIDYATELIKNIALNRNDEENYTENFIELTYDLAQINSKLELILCEMYILEHHIKEQKLNGK